MTKQKIAALILTGISTAFVTLLMTCCGQVVPDHINVQVSGGVAIQLDVTSFIPYLESICSKKYTVQADITACVTNDITALTTYLESLQ